MKKKIILTITAIVNTIAFIAFWLMHRGTWMLPCMMITGLAAVISFIELSGFFEEER